MPRHWFSKIVIDESTEPDGYYEEVAWLLDAFLDGLRTPRVSKHNPLDLHRYDN